MFSSPLTRTHMMGIESCQLNGLSLSPLRVVPGDVIMLDDHPQAWVC